MIGTDSRRFRRDIGFAVKLKNISRPHRFGGCFLFCCGIKSLCRIRISIQGLGFRRIEQWRAVQASPNEPLIGLRQLLQ